ncbi:hypothetical protein J1N35_026841 [Gossypium stocksii]|uniref:CCHC-type domain-containing protein n=1 Tax=Gossypium stocksii TaxID=47602 RepID=A0A9D3VAD3_9ROSI|nr:hypothetical protein J1N35_026841 [Gossypium stocksii]
MISIKCKGKFLDYDTSIPPMGYKSYMRIRVLLDVSGPLKRKKKVQIGKSKTVYVHFKYEKLSLFCFICGKLGHGESYCPYRLKIEPSKIIFGWDLSLRVAVRCQNVAVNRWLCEADGSRCKAKKRKSNNQGMNCNEEKDIRSNSRKDIGNQQLNPNLIPLGSNNQFGIDESNKWRRWSKDDLFNDGLAIRPMDLVIEAENNPIAMLEGKKKDQGSWKALWR